MLLSLDDHLYAKNLRGRSIPSRYIDDQRILPAVWLDKRYNWPHPIISGSLQCCLPLMTNSMQRYHSTQTKGITLFLPEILMIKESCNLIGRETQVANPIKRGSPRCHLHLMTPCKKSKNQKISMQKIYEIEDFFQRYW